MKLRCVNAVLTVLSVIMTFAYGIMLGLRALMRGRLGVSQSFSLFFALCLLVLISAHALISIYILFFQNGQPVRDVSSPLSSRVSRVAGFATLVFLFGHVAVPAIAAKVSLVLPPAVRVITSVLIVGTVVVSMVYAAFALPNALATLSLVDTKRKYRVSFVVSALLSAAVGAFTAVTYLYGVA